VREPGGVPGGGLSGTGEVDEALVGARFGGLDAFQFGVRAEDRHFDREGRARIVVASAAQRLQRLGLGQQRPALHPADLPDRRLAPQARRQHLLDELVPEAGTTPHRLAEPAGQLLPPGFGDRVDAPIGTHSHLGFHPRGDESVTLHFPRPSLGNQSSVPGPAQQAKIIVPTIALSFPSSPMVTSTPASSSLH
jgi:hypothetical protein